MLVSFAIIIQLLISLSLCQVQPGSKIDLTPGSFTVSGKIENPSDRTITIISHEIFGRENHLTKVNEKGEFNLIVPILSPHDNMLMYDNQIILTVHKSVSQYDSKSKKDSSHCRLLLITSR